MSKKPSKKTIENIFSAWRAKQPNPVCELTYKSEFELLIAVMLSAQATDISVNKVTPALFAAANTAEKMHALGEACIIEYIKTIGLYRNKAKHIMATCSILVSQYQGQVPNQRSALEKLPGVGRKTANVVLNTAFKQPTIAVDTHVSRVSQRLRLAKSTSPNNIEQELYRSIPTQYQMHAHHWLILHGRYICKARKPLCNLCEISQWCQSNDKTQ